MVIICNRIPVNREHDAAFEELFATRMKLVDGMPGFIGFQLLRPTQPDDPYIVMTTWASEADFRAWVGSAEFKAGHARVSTLPKGTITSHPALEIYELCEASRAMQ